MLAERLVRMTIMIGGWQVAMLSSGAGDRRHWTAAPIGTLATPLRLAAVLFASKPTSFCATPRDKPVPQWPHGITRVPAPSELRRR